MRKTVYGINKIIIFSKSKNYFFSVLGQNNNANFDTDVEAGAASEDENQVHFFRTIILMMIIIDVINMIKYEEEKKFFSQSSWCLPS